MQYTPPAPAELRRLKEALDLTGEQMAELFGLAGGQQWRKYTGGQDPREMNLQMLFFAAARLELAVDDIARVVNRMREIGASVHDLPPINIAQTHKENIDMNPACWRVRTPGVRATEEDIDRLKNNIPENLQLYIGKLEATKGFDPKGLFYDISFVVNGPERREDELQAWFHSVGLVARNLLPEPLDNSELP